MDWLYTVQMRAKEDPWYQVCMEKLRNREPGYLTIWETLPAEQQRQLDDYISACEAVDEALMGIAYQLGKENTATGNNK